MKNNVLYLPDFQNVPYAEGTKEESNILNEFLNIMKQQGLNEAALIGVIRDVVQIQSQFGAMAHELQEVKEQLAKFQQNQPDVTNKSKAAFKEVTRLKEGAERIAEGASKARKSLVDTAAKSISTFKEKGKEAMCNILQKGIDKAASLLYGCQNHIEKTLADYEIAAGYMAELKNELKQMERKIDNVGKIVTEKEGKKERGEKEGKSITKMLNKPVEKVMTKTQKQLEKLERAKTQTRGQLEKVEKAIQKLEQFSSFLRGERGKGEKTKVSIMDKLSENKAEIMLLQEQKQPLAIEMKERPLSTGISR